MRRLARGEKKDVFEREPVLGLLGDRQVAKVDGVKGAADDPDSFLVALALFVQLIDPIPF